MAQKVSVSGTVEAVNDRGFKINGKWFNKAQRFNGAVPGVGDKVSFDAYGPKEDLIYRFTIGEGSSNASTGHAVVQPTVARAVAGKEPGGNRNPDNPRGTALLAAATLMQGSEGTVQQVASNAIAIARAFEVYLAGVPAPQSDEAEGLYWVAPVIDYPIEDLGREEN
jgi:hypothetical protein